MLASIIIAAVIGANQVIIDGRTIPSFRNVIAEEKQEWKSFRNALDKSERKAFDEM